MKIKKVLRFLIIIILIIICSAVVWYYNLDRTYSGPEWARQYLLKAMNHDVHNYMPVNGLVPDKKTAIDLATIVLSKIYGKRHIWFQKPFEVHLIEDYWVIQGTLIKGIYSGTVIIVISKKDGQIINLTHSR